MSFKYALPVASWRSGYRIKFVLERDLNFQIVLSIDSKGFFYQLLLESNHRISFRSACFLHKKVSLFCLRFEEIF